MGRAGHIPLRRCVGCRRVRPQAELVRFARGADGPQLDLEGRAGGRGSWVCREPACWTPKQLGRSFRAHTESVCSALRAHADDIHIPTPTQKQPSQTGGLHV